MYNILHGAIAADVISLALETSPTADIQLPFQTQYFEKYNGRKHALSTYYLYCCIETEGFFKVIRCHITSNFTNNLVISLQRCNVGAQLLRCRSTNRILYVIVIP